MLSKGSEEPLAQGRCSGYGGGFKAVKVSGGCSSESCEEHIEQPKTERKEMDMFSLERKNLPVYLPIPSVSLDPLPSIAAVYAMLLVHRHLGLTCCRAAGIVLYNVWSVASNTNDAS